MEGISTLDLVGRVALAVALGALIGLEREARDHPAGLRTHALVAAGAALFTMAGAYGFADIATSTNVDPARVAAQVATGIGFIGAGAILKIGMSVRGLTTAATLWMSAALGVAAGSGAYVLAAVGAAAVLAVVVGLRGLKLPFLDRVLFTVEYARGHGTLGTIMSELERVGGRPGRLRITDESAGEGSRRVSIRVSVRDESDLERVAGVLRGRPEVHWVHWDRDA